MRQIKLWPKTTTNTKINLSDHTLRSLLQLPKHKGAFKAITWNGYSLTVEFEKETQSTLIIK